MPASRHTFTLSCVVGFLTLLGGVVYSQLGVPEPLPLSKGEQMPPEVTLPPVGHLGNILKAPGGHELPQSAMATALKNRVAPEARTKHFQSLLNNPEFRLTGWSVEVRSTQVVNGVEVAATRVTPLITTKGGTSAVVLGFIDETYELKGQSFKLLKSETSAGSEQFAIIND